MLTKYWFLIFLWHIRSSSCNVQYGPDPWDSNPSITYQANAPPDLRDPSMKDSRLSYKRREGNGIDSEWFFRRILAVMLKSGQNQMEDDGSIEIHLKVTKEKQESLEKILKSTDSFTDSIYREVLMTVEESIYTPSIIEVIVVTWSEYFLSHLEHNKTIITISFAAAGVIWSLILMRRHFSRWHTFLILFLLLYVYEAFVSYKEAEKQEYEHFVSALNACKWNFWSSSCEIPPPDPLLFFKHMHPLKIGLRMFTMLVSEPMVAFSSTLQQMLHGLTDGLWFPFNKLAYMSLVLMANIILIMLVIMVLFNFILNIPFNLSFFAGLVSIGVKERKSYLPSDSKSERNTVQQIDEGDKISGQNLDKLLSFCAHAIQSSNSTQSSNLQNQAPVKAKRVELKRSSSTGRLPDSNHNVRSIKYKDRVWNTKAKFEIGSGDYL